MLQDIGTLVTAAGVLLAWLSLQAVRRQRLRRFEMIYVQRYWQLMDGLSLEALTGPRGELQRSDARIVRGYLRLCEDELELRGAGWISDETWAVWGPGIHTQLGRWPFREVWAQILQENAARPEQLREFQCLQDFFEPGGTDPCPRAVRWRRVLQTGGPRP